MGLYDASFSTGGSVSQGYNTAQSASSGWGWSNTAGNYASAVAAARAQEANAMQEYFMDKTMSYNSYEAQLQRDWEYQMAATQYQRAVADLRAAGLNPVLAASKGIGSSIGGGAAANVGIPSAFMGKTFAEQNAANGSESWMNSNGENWGQSWQNSESGLATFITAMTGLVEGLMNNTASANQIDINLNMAEKAAALVEKQSEKEKKKYTDKSTQGTTKHIAKNIVPEAGSFLYGVEQYMRAHGLLSK